MLTKGTKRGIDASVLADPAIKQLMCASKKGRGAKPFFDAMTTFQLPGR
jgi:hypothetical protein